MEPPVKIKQTPMIGKKAIENKNDSITQEVPKKKWSHKIDVLGKGKDVLGKGKAKAFPSRLDPCPSLPIDTILSLSSPISLKELFVVVNKISQKLGNL